MPEGGERMTRLRKGQELICLPQVCLETKRGRGLITLELFEQSRLRVFD